jgi:hypothetical protein
MQTATRIAAVPKSVPATILVDVVGDGEHVGVGAACCA